MKPGTTPQTAAARLKKISRLRPTLAVVLGSGFHQALPEFHLEDKVPFAEIPGFPRPAVAGHAGQLHFGRLGQAPLMVLSGRAHYYEGHPMEHVAFPVRALAAFGIRDLLLTNAAGAINWSFRPGDFMIVTDHINFMGANPLRATVNSPFKGFLDLSDTYDAGLNRLLSDAGKRCHIKLRRGTYLAVSGPTYETPAEIRAFARLGADAVGMSTVPEAIVARHCGLRVAAVSCITNLAAGRGPRRLSHDEVMATAEKVKTLAAQLLKCFVQLHSKVAARR